MIWPRLYRHVTSESLAALESCEREALGRRVAPARYWKMGRLFLREDYLNRLLSPELLHKTDATIRFVTGRSPSFWRATRALAHMRLVRSAADLILLKNNLRAFFIAEGYTLKVSNPGETDAARRVAQEAERRTHILAGGNISAPDILKAGKSGSAAFILEHLLEGWSPLANAGPAFIRNLIAFQKANSVEHGNRPDIGRLFTELDDALAALNLAMPRRASQVLSGLARRETAPEPWGLCHGDLSRSNIFQQQERYVIVDWEFASLGPSSLDAVRLSTQFANFAEDYIKALAHDDARDWLLLACLRSILEHRNRWLGLVDNRHGAAVRRKTVKKTSEILELIGAIGGGPGDGRT